MGASCTDRGGSATIARRNTPTTKRGVAIATTIRPTSSAVSSITLSAASSAIPTPATPSRGDLASAIGGVASSTVTRTTGTYRSVRTTRRTGARSPRGTSTRRGRRRGSACCGRRIGAIGRAVTQTRRQVTGVLRRLRARMRWGKALLSELGRGIQRRSFRSSRGDRQQSNRRRELSKSATKH